MHIDFVLRTDAPKYNTISKLPNKFIIIVVFTWVPRISLLPMPSNHSCLYKAYRRIALDSNNTCHQVHQICENVISRRTLNYIHYISYGVPTIVLARAVLVSSNLATPKSPILTK